MAQDTVLVVSYIGTETIFPKNSISQIQDYK